MTKRLVWADSIKGYLMLLVIMGHCIATAIGNDAANANYWWCLIYSFHMPAFIAISGYLNWKGVCPQYKVSEIVFRRFRQLMVPFMSWSVIKIAIGGGSIDEFYNCILYPTNTFWFLWALFFIVTLFEILNQAVCKTGIKQEIIMGAVCVLCASIMVIFKDIRIFGIQYILYYFIFYCLGYYINKYQIQTDKKWVTVLLLIVWFILGSFWRPRELPSFLPLTGSSATIVRFAYKFIVAFVAVLAIFSFSPKVLNGRNKFNYTVCKFGSMSLGIYTSHLIITGMVVNFVNKYVDNDIVVVLSSFVLLTMMSYSVVTLLGKWKWTSRLFLGKI